MKKAGGRKQVLSLEIELHSMQVALPMMLSASSTTSLNVILSPAKALVSGHLLSSSSNAATNFASLEIELHSMKWLSWRRASWVRLLASTMQLRMLIHQVTQRRISLSQMSVVT
jgi:hypothetical protein